MELADELLPSREGKTRIRIILASHPGDIEYCFTKLIDKWEQLEEDTTWQKLIDALRHTQRLTLASNIENSLLTNSIEGSTQHVQDGDSQHVAIVSPAQPLQADNQPIVEGMYVHIPVHVLF